MKHIMLDLETLGVAPGCKVLSIGAVEFGTGGLGAEFYSEVDRLSQPGLVENPATLKWWESQPAEVRDRLFTNTTRKPTMRQALEGFNEWLGRLGQPKDLVVWGNGADFDQPILLAAYATIETAQAWGTYNNRCYRTLKDLAPQVKLVRQGAKHNALDDAKTQAEHAIRLMKELKVWQA